jgi:ATP-dependent Zn protease
MSYLWLQQQRRNGDYRLWLGRNRDAHVSAHEAGHVCAAWLLGLDLARATIEPGDGFAGMVTSRRSSEITDREQAFDRVVFLMAGNEAEKLLGAPADCGKDDLRQARALADSFCRSEDDVDDMVADARRAARRMLKAHAAALITVTIALRIKRTLDADDIEAIMSPYNDSDDDDDDGVTLAEMMAGSGLRSRRVVLYRNDGGVI